MRVALLALCVMAGIPAAPRAGEVRGEVRFHGTPAASPALEVTKDRRVCGESAPDVQWIAPLPVDVRESTDTIATRFSPAAVAMKHFRQHALEYNFTPSRAAEELGISVATLHRWFKVHAGQTPAQMIEERRVNHALDLLQNTHVGLKEATTQSGFSEPRQLRRAIKRRLGVKPRSFQSLELNLPARRVQKNASDVKGPGRTSTVDSN